MASTSAIELLSFRSSVFLKLRSLQTEVSHDCKAFKIATVRSKVWHVKMRHPERNANDGTLVYHRLTSRTEARQDIYFPSPNTSRT